MTVKNNEALDLNDKESADCLNALIDTGLFPAMIMDNQFKQIKKVNKVAAAMFGDADEDSLESFTFFVDEEDRQDMLEALNTNNSVKDVEFPLRVVEDAEIWVAISAIKAKILDEECIFATFNDLTQLRELEERLRLMNRTDTLTGIINHSHFLEIGSKEISRCRRHGNSMSVMVIDIDEFAKFNSEYGHDKGDEAIRRIAKKIEQALRTSDVVSRLGIEEFAIILTETEGSPATLTAERLRDTLSKLPVETKNGKEISFTVSIGVSELQPEDESIETALSRAYVALHKAKRTGKNKVEYA